MEWHWHEAPIFAVLDLLTIQKPIPRDTFIDCMSHIAEDPYGPYGKVLLNSPHFLHSKNSAVNKKKQKNQAVNAGDKKSGDTASFLEQTAGLFSKDDTAGSYKNMLDSLDIIKLSANNAALLIIDPQRSFTKGVWMRSAGTRAELEVKPIQIAFDNCSRFLKKHYGSIEAMFTRCPFPPDSYGWDGPIDSILDPAQLYFVKPGNSVLFPPSNGFREWVKRCVDNGKKTLVIGGCTLNSCVRVSSIETQEYFRNDKLQVAVDLTLCGARADNYKGASAYGGLSAVEAAVREMMDAGIIVTKCAEWI